MLATVLPMTFEQGLSYALIALGIALTFRVLAFPDLTVDGSFPLGGAVCARLIVEGMDPLLATICATGAGFLAGCCTGLLNTKLKINSLLSGILMMTILYSVNLRVMGRANTPLLTVDTLFTPLDEMAMGRDIPVILMFLGVIIAVKVLTDVFLHTEYGLALRATGDNEQMIRSLGVNTDSATVFGLGLSNALVCLGGALIAQDQGFADVGMGIGMIVAGLASIIIGEAMVKQRTAYGIGFTGIVGGVTAVMVILSFVIPSTWVSEELLLVGIGFGIAFVLMMVNTVFEVLLKPSVVFRLTMAAVVGSIIYRTILTIGMRMGLAPTDLKLATGLMVVLALGIPAIRGGKEAKVHLRGV